MPAPTSNPAELHSDDQALVRAVLERVPGAFERLVRQYQRLCWHIIDRMVRQPDDTQELCQEVFLRVHQTLHQYRGESLLKSWIAQVAYSVGKRHLERKRIPIVEPDASDAHALLVEQVGDGHDLEAAMADKEIARHLHDALDRLPPLQRTLLTLYHLEELPIGEVAKVTGLAEGTIKSHLFRSRKLLRGLLEARIGVPS